jgi:ABC-type glutathione transport system ATPase component
VAPTDGVCLLPAPTPNRALIEVRDLTVCYGGTSEPRFAVRELNFSIAAGEVLGIQGRSGCGKTSTALALLNLLPPAARVSGSVAYGGRNLLALNDSELRTIRGRDIAIVYQEPALALNPVMRVGAQISEVLRAHIPQKSAQRKHRVRQMLDRVHLNPDRFYDAYPHELSGGERHRVCLAQALICSPSLVMADEPTAGLDATLKNEILDLIASLRRDFGAAFLLISHDHSVIDRLADRTLELSGSQEKQRPVYRPVLDVAVREPGNIGTLEPLIRVSNLSKWYGSRGLFRRKNAEKRALDSVDLTIPKNSLVALVGPSGSGKSTLARCLALLETADSGEILFNGKNLRELNTKQLREHRPLLQYIAQDSSEALNPRLTASEAVEEPLLIQRRFAKTERRTQAKEIMRQVGLDPATASRSCHEFSGGQKHRLVIARALALKPQLLILDESLSGLDPETQNGILGLLVHLKQHTGVAQLLISHDLDLVAKVADVVAVMQDGCVIEHATHKQVLENPEHWSTEHVMHAAVRQELVLAEAE